MTTLGGEQRAKPAKHASVTCPCCGWTGDAFQPFGVRPRPNARCPNCGSLERHRALYFYFTRQASILSGEAVRMLHFAPEPVMANLFRGHAHINYVTTDLTMPNVSVRMDITDLLFKDDVFDWVLCSHVLEHIPDDRRALRELHRVLKPTGTAVILVPLRPGLAKTWEDSAITSPEERLRVYGQSDHVRNCGRDYRDRIETAGFTITERNLHDELPRDEVRRHGLKADDLIYIAAKVTRPRAREPRGRRPGPRSVGASNGR